MDDIFSFMSYNQPYILLLLSIFCAGILLTNYHYTKQLCESFLNRNNLINSDFDYGPQRGPHKWKEFFPAARGSYQSPINIRTETTEVLKISGPLMWRNYDELPVKVTIENTGHTVEMTAQYSCYNLPTLLGADLLESYSFVSLCFRWSALDNEGSEHSIDDRKYPLEMQASHFSKENRFSSRDCEGNSRILVLTYFFAITQFDNPYLDPIILNLHLVREPLKQVTISPFPLSWLCYPFKSSFYSYGGSLTEPPCTEGVTWFVQPEPMSISENQISQFRRLLSKDRTTRILRNSRPVQHLNSRIICYNRYDQFRRLSEAVTDSVEQASPEIQF